MDWTLIIAAVGIALWAVAGLAEILFKCWYGVHRRTTGEHRLPLMERYNDED